MTWCWRWRWRRHVLQEVVSDMLGAVLSRLRSADKPSLILPLLLVFCQVINNQGAPVFLDFVCGCGAEALPFVMQLWTSNMKCATPPSPALMAPPSSRKPSSRTQHVEPCRAVPRSAMPAAVPEHSAACPPRSSSSPWLGGAERCPAGRGAARPQPDAMPRVALCRFLVSPYEINVCCAALAAVLSTCDERLTPVQVTVEVPREGTRQAKPTPCLPPRGRHAAPCLPCPPRDSSAREGRLGRGGQPRSSP